MDLFVSAQLRALRDYARANGYSVTRQHVDEAESGRVATGPRSNPPDRAGGSGPGGRAEMTLRLDIGRVHV